VSYDETLAALDRLARFGIRLGLDNMRAACERLGRPDRAGVVVHVAGTNGKGTTAAALAALARAHGLRAGLTTSPHLVDLRERIRIDGRAVAAADVVRSWARVRGEVEARRMTYFEATTLVAFDLFARAGLDLTVVEVGMGGRLDATNVVEPALTLVTGIARDHERWLGSDLAQVAREKAGIFKPGVPALVGDPGPPAVRDAFVAAAREAGAPLGFLPNEARWQLREVAPGRTRFDYESEVVDLRDLQLPLTGAPFAAAAALALRAWERMAGPGARIVPPLEEPRARAALADSTLGGRGEWRIVDGVGHLLDVAHNPSGCARLAETVRAAGLDPVALVFAALADKAWSDMLDALAPLTASAWLCELATAGDRRLAREAAEEAVERRGIAWAPDVAFALRMARAEVERGRAACVLVAGSFHTVGESLVALGLADPAEPYEPAAALVAAR
jgi:dihydrofolate synthase/folylpolyglutamate synthase